MSSGKLYSNNAQRCRALAQRASTEYGREIFIELAKRWDELIADKNLPVRLDNAKIGQTKFHQVSRPER